MTVYGVKWHSDATSPVLDRLESNVGKTAGASFDTLPPWTMRRCNLWSDGTVTAYYGDRCYTDTDVANMGQCMVQIPKFWYAVDASLANHVAYYISDTATPSPAIRNLANTADLTFAVHPAFIVGGVSNDYAYCSAFEGYYNSTTGKLESNGNNLVTATGVSMPTHRGYAQAVGTGWELWTIQLNAALKLLFITEYATLNSQLITAGGLGNGVTATAVLNTGYTSIGGTHPMGNASYGTNANETTPMSYRGVENLWGNRNHFLEGVNITATTYVPWVAPQTKLRTTGNKYLHDRFDTPYVEATGVSVTATDNFITNVDTTVLPWAFIPTTYGAGRSATAFFCDSHTHYAGNAVASVGGVVNLSTGAGLFNWYDIIYSTTNAAYGSRLCYLP